MPIVYGYALSNEDTEACKRFYDEALRDLAGQGILWGGCFIEPEINVKVDFRKRQAGKLLYDRLKQGDHVVLQNIALSFRNSTDCNTVNGMWRNLEVTAHYLDCGVLQNDPLFQQRIEEAGLFKKKDHWLKGLRTRRQAAGEAWGKKPPIGYYIVNVQEKGQRPKKLLRLSYPACRIASYILDMRAGEWSFKMIALILNKLCFYRPDNPEREWDTVTVSRYYQFAVQHKLERNAEWRQRDMSVIANWQVAGMKGGKKLIDEISKQTPNV